MKRRLVFLTLLAVVSARAADRPNIIFIFSDDHAQHAISAYGSKVIQTPHLDRLAREGARFTRSFCLNSICTPSRATLLTGQYSHLNGVPAFNRFDGSRDHVAKHLQAGGYHTGIIGKWHLGSDPTDFDRWLVLPGQGAYWDPAFLAPGRTLTIEGHCTDIITELGLEFLKTRPKDKPFFLMLHHKAPHRNWAPAPRHIAMFKDKVIPEPATLFDDYATRPTALPANEQTIARDLSRRDLKLAEVLLRGKRQRDYVDAAMPQFGEANVGHLLELFGKVDQLEAAVFPKVANILESKNAGYEMIGTDGLSCIVCHEFNGQKSGEMSALDLARVTERLKKNWFALYMRQPSRFHPTVIMPSFWPDGQSTRPAILGGDTAQQIEALWSYLEDGTRAKKPVGLSRQSNELRVGDTTEICRGQSPVGYRGIGVGYPERISLAFDSGEMALRQLWKGDFASIDLGHFQPRGTDAISFPPGIPFHRLTSLEDNWPYKGKTNHAFPQDHGYQFRGYTLDAARRPTLLYHYGDIAVEDFFEDARDKDGQAYFKRTLRFDAPVEQSPFYFRAAAGKKITATDRTFTVDKLQVRITSDHQGVVREGENGDVLIPLTLPKGRSTLTLEYQW